MSTQSVLHERGPLTVAFLSRQEEGTGKVGETGDEEVTGLEPEHQTWWERRHLVLRVMMLWMMNLQMVCNGVDAYTTHDCGSVGLCYCRYVLDGFGGRSLKKQQTNAGTYDNLNLG